MGILHSKKTAFILYLGVALILYSNSLDNGFHYDDRHMISENRAVQEMSRFVDHWNQRYLPGDDPAMRIHYRPVVYSSYLLNYVAGETDPRGYHLVNLAVHVGTAVLTALVLERLTGRRLVGILGGGLFLIHPFNAEAVNYITARSSQLYAFFFLLAFYAYLRYRDRTAPTSLSPAGWLGICCAAFALSLLSKEMAVTFPAVLLLYEGIVRRGEGWRERLRAWSIPAGFASLGVLFYLIMRREAIEAVMSGEVLIPGQGEKLDWISRSATQGVAVVRTLGLILWPRGLTVDHRVDVYSTFLTWPAAGALILLAGAVGLILWRGRSGEVGLRVGAFLLAWFFVSLAPLAAIPLNAILQENRAYLAGVGVFGLGAMAAVRLLDRVKRRRGSVSGGLWVGIGILALVYSGVTIQRNVAWQDEISLWTDAIRKNPDSGGAHLALGTAYHQKKEFDLAVKEYREALKINPTDYRVRGNLAQVYRQQGDYAGAIEEYGRVIRLAPSDPEAHYGLGLACQLSGRLDQAVSEYRIALALNPAHERAGFRLGKILESRGEKRGAEARQPEVLMD